MGAPLGKSHKDRYSERGQPSKIKVKRMFSHSSSGWRESSTRPPKSSIFKFSKTHKGTEVFLNGNDEPDIVLQDCDGDGMYDTVEHIGPPTPSGKLPMLAFDGKDAGKPDTIIMDTTGDGRYDHLLSRAKAPLSFLAAMSCASSDTLGENLNNPPRPGMLTETEFQAERNCPAGHELKKCGTDDSMQYKCSACSRTFLKGTRLWGCRKCSFNLCAPCMCEAYGRPLCPGWEVGMSDSSLSYFFYHSESGRSTWDRSDAETQPEVVLDRSSRESWRSRRKCNHPIYWKHAGEDGNFQEVVPTDSAFVRTVQLLITSTFMSIRTRDRNTRMPTHLEVVKVWRVENASVWRQYAQRKSELQSLAKETKGGSLMNCKPAPKTMDILPKDHRKSLDASVSEVYLFHGTSPLGALGIADTGFDISKTSKGCLYGRGIYCAESSSKSDEYAEEDTEGFQAGNCAMLLCRALLGTALIWDKNVGKDLVKEWAQGGYHSIIGDREKLRGTYREFVIPKVCCQGVYPEYIIIYRRRFNK